MYRCRWLSLLYNFRTSLLKNHNLYIYERERERKYPFLIKNLGGLLFLPRYSKFFVFTVQLTVETEMPLIFSFFVLFYFSFCLKRFSSLSYVKSLTQFQHIMLSLSLFFLCLHCLHFLWHIFFRYCQETILDLFETQNPFSHIDLFFLSETQNPFI